MVFPSGTMTEMKQKVCKHTAFCFFLLCFNTIFFYLDSKLYNWLTQEISIPDELLRFVVVAERGGYKARDDKGDICFDDFYVEEGPCYSGKLLYSIAVS